MRGYYGLGATRERSDGSSGPRDEISIFHGELIPAAYTRLMIVCRGGLSENRYLKEWREGQNEGEKECAW